MIKPIGKNVSATIDKANEKTLAGLFVGAAQAQALAPKVATIQAIGDEVTKVKAGQSVIFKPYATYEINIKSAVEAKKDDSFQVILEEDDILGIIEDD